MKTNRIFDEIPLEKDVVQEHITYESVLTTKQGEEIPVEVQVKNIDDKIGNIKAIVIRDITKRKMAQNELTTGTCKKYALYD
jgi:PAS domain S-box-containing protein